VSSGKLRGEIRAVGGKGWRVWKETSNNGKVRVGMSGTRSVFAEIRKPTQER